MCKEKIISMHITVHTLGNNGICIQYILTPPKCLCFNSSSLNYWVQIVVLEICGETLQPFSLNNYSQLILLLTVKEVKLTLHVFVYIT